MTRVFVLSAQRSGTLTFAKACEHATNYTVGHESRWGYVGDDRFAFPDNHIEVDNRLAWFPGELVIRFPDAVYVHLMRDPKAVAESCAWRFHKGLMRQFAEFVGRGRDGFPEATIGEVCEFYVQAVERNIEALHCALAHRHEPAHFGWCPKQFPWWEIHIDDPCLATQFNRLWAVIGAEGDLQAALAEFDVRYNASEIT